MNLFLSKMTAKKPTRFKRSARRSKEARERKKNEWKVRWIVCNGLCWHICRFLLHANRKYEMTLVGFNMQSWIVQFHFNLFGIFLSSHIEWPIRDCATHTHTQFIVHKYNEWLYSLYSDDGSRQSFCFFFLAFGSEGPFFFCWYFELRRIVILCTTILKMVFNVVQLKFWMCH